MYTFYYTYSAELFCTNHGDQRVVFNLKSSKLSSLSLSVSFEYLCYGSTTIQNIGIPSLLGLSLYGRICSLQTADFDV